VRRRDPIATAATPASRTTIPMSTNGSDDVPVLASGLTALTTVGAVVGGVGPGTAAVVVVGAAVTVMVPCMIA